MTRCIVCNSDFPESLAICLKCGFVPDASLVDPEYPKLDPNVPDLKNYWCRKCRGHHDTFLSGSGDCETRVCKNCSSEDVHLVWLDITKRKFLFRFWGYPIWSFLRFSVTIPASFWMFSFRFRLAHGDDRGHEGGHHGLPPEVVLTDIGSFAITNSMVFTWLVALSLILMNLIPLSVVFQGCSHYKKKLAVRNEWLDWAKERGFDENAENK
jgi:hypothetical protein